MIYIYYSYLSHENHKNLLKNELVKFPTDFQEKIKQYRRWQDAQLSLLGRIILLRAIKEIYNQDYQNKKIHHTKYNKPYFEDNSIPFNVSHSGSIVVCAINDKSEIGIDIEMVSTIEIDNFKSQFTEGEWNKILFSNNKREDFFEYWTKKEAVIKAHGHGLSISLQSFEIIENATIINNEKFHLQEIKIEKQYKCYIASKNHFSKIFIKQIPNN